jgi:hypothetical protein
MSDIICSHCGSINPMTKEEKENLDYQCNVAKDGRCDSIDCGHALPHKYNKAAGDEFGHTYCGGHCFGYGSVKCVPQFNPKTGKEIK